MININVIYYICIYHFIIIFSNVNLIGITRPVRCQSTDQLDLQSKGHLTLGHSTHTRLSKGRAGRVTQGRVILSQQLVG